LIAASPGNWNRYIGWFKAKLRTPNVNITLLPPNGADGDPTAIQQAANYLAANVEVIVTASTQAALACKAATQSTATQVVFASVGDPAISGLSPQAGGKFTGCSNQQVKLVSKRVAHMKNHNLPGPVAVVGNYNVEPIKSAMTLAVSALQAEGMNPQLASIASGDDIGAFINNLRGQGIKSLYVCSDMFITANSTELNRKAHAAGMKTMFEFSEHVDDHGGDLSFGVSFKDLFEKAAEYVDKILGGTKAGDLPIYEPPQSKLQQAARKGSARSTSRRHAYAPKKKSRRGS
jgi:putative ABC transport system substrate-binding protein